MNRSIIALAATTTLLCACGGGSGSSDVNAPVAPQISGKVADG